MGRKKSKKIVGGETANLAFNAGKKAFAKGLPLTHYKGNNVWYRKEWQRGWKSVGGTTFQASAQVCEDVSNLSKVVQTEAKSELINAKLILKDLWFRTKLVLKNRWFQLIGLFLILSILSRDSGPQISYIKVIETPKICQVCTIVTPVIMPVVTPTVTVTPVPTQILFPVTSVSRKGINFIKFWEGLSLVPYGDIGGCSIGYGHFLHIGGCSNLDHATGWSQVTDYLNADLITVENYLNEANFNLDPAQYDAIASIIFNMGWSYGTDENPKGFKATEIYKLLVEGKLDEVPDSIRVHVGAIDGSIPSVLVRRREAEARLFTTGEEPNYK